MASLANCKGKGRHHSRGTAFLIGFVYRRLRRKCLAPYRTLGDHPSERLPHSFFTGRLSSSGIAPKRRIKSNIPSQLRNATLSPLCTCSMRPRQRGPATDHSCQKRTTKVLIGGTGGSAMRRTFQRQDPSDFRNPKDLKAYGLTRGHVLLCKMVFRSAS